MRCPYCGNINADKASFCATCGRDLKVQQPVGRPPVSQPVPGRVPPAPSARPQSPARPVTPAQPAQLPGRPASYPQPRLPGQLAPLHPPVSADAFGSATITAVVGPEAPAPFPPHTIAHLNALEAGGLEFTELSEETIGLRGKKIVRILYPRCIHWQQVATLLKAKRKYQSAKYPHLIIQGFYNRDESIHAFNNGQLVFDQGVMLGSQMLNRYLIDTGTGFEGEAVRIVMTDD